MLQTFGDQPSQPTVVMYYEQSQPAGTAVSLSDASGSLLLSHSPSKEFSAAVISVPELTDGDTYTLTTGKSAEEFTLSGITNPIGAKTAASDTHRGGMPSENQVTPEGQMSFSPIFHNNSLRFP